MINKTYPTKEDIEKHTKQLVIGLRAYFIGLNRNYAFLKNDLRCLWTDLLLEAQNSKDIKLGDLGNVELNFDKFLKKLIKNEIL